MPALFAPETTVRRPPLGVLVLLGAISGVALQLQQASLWVTPIYGVISVLAPVFIALTAIKLRATVHRQWAWRLLLVAAALALGFGSTGWRARTYLATDLAPALEGRDVEVQGVVTGLPQLQAAGVRFRLQVVQARLDGQPVALPALMDVGWYSGWGSSGGGGLELQRQPLLVHPGEAWQLRLRVKAVHGNRNPYGFDYELHQWEQGVQASAYVRAGLTDPAPQRLPDPGGWVAPVDRLRDAVRQRIVAQVEDHQAAALIAALVLGDQAGIERGPRH